MSRWIWLVCVAGMACRSDRWIETHATELHVNGFAAPIPAGWRDLHELVEPPIIARPPGSRTLLPESGGLGEILVSTIPAAVVTNELCAAIGAGANAAGSNNHVAVGEPQAATFDGDRGCSMTVRVQGLSGKLAIRSHERHTVMVRCVGLAEGPACDTVLYGLHLVTP